MAKPLFVKAGGYRKLHGFTFATMIHLGTIRFFKTFISCKDDPLGKTTGHMIGAARSGRQNIIEGSERAATPRETGIKLTDIARASLAELPTMRRPLFSVMSHSVMPSRQRKPRRNHP